MVHQLFMPASWLPLERRAEIRFPARDRSSSKKFKFVACSSTTSAADGVFLLPNALRRERNPSWSTGFSLGVDLGNSRTGLALGKGLAPPRPLIVLEMRGQKLEARIMEIAEREEVDEFIIGLPRSHDGKETPQSNAVRSVAGRLAVRAAESGWRVFLQDEHGTSVEALNCMIAAGLKKSSRQKNVDSYAAVMVLERYFSDKGHGAELVLPKNLELQDKLKQGLYSDDEL